MKVPEFAEFKGILDGIERQIFINPSLVGCIIKIGNESLIFSKGSIPCFKVQDSPEAVISKLHFREKE